MKRDFATFHLSLAVPDLAETEDFFDSVLGFSISRMDGYSNVDFLGHQLTLRSSGAALESHPQALDHFGANVTCDLWDAIHRRVAGRVKTQVVGGPRGKKLIVFGPELVIEFKSQPQSASPVSSCN